jgi:hypothetical protein
MTKVLVLRDAGQLAGPPPAARVVEGDVLDREQLDPAVRGQDVVYANLTGDLDVQAARIVASMRAARPAPEANRSKGPRSPARAWPPSSPTSPHPRVCGHARTWV